jgi:hypothetical protein
MVLDVASLDSAEIEVAGVRAVQDLNKNEVNRISKRIILSGNAYDQGAITGPARIWSDVGVADHKIIASVDKQTINGIRSFMQYNASAVIVQLELASSRYTIGGPHVEAEGSLSRRTDNRVDPAAAGVSSSAAGLEQCSAADKRAENKTNESGGRQHTISLFGVNSFPGGSVAGIDRG